MSNSGSASGSIKPSVLIVTAICSFIALTYCNHVYAIVLESGQGLNALAPALEAGLTATLMTPFAITTKGDAALAVNILALVLPWGVVMNSDNMNGNFMPGTEHGSSHWLTKAEIAKYSDPKDPENNLILSMNARLKFQPKKFDLEHDRNKNVLIIGGPGSGKTRYVIKPNLMQLNSSVWITDPKGTLVPEVAGMFVKCGYRVRTLNTIDFNLSNHFNPFAYIKKESDVPNIVQCLITNVKPKDAGKAGDPFWENTEKMLLNALVAYMYEALDPKQRTFRTLNKLIDMIKISESKEDLVSPLDVVFSAWEYGDISRDPKMRNAMRTMSKEERAFLRRGEPHPASYACELYRQFKVGAGKTLKSVLMSVHSDLWQFALPELLDLTDYDEMDLGSLGGLVEEDLLERAKTDPGILEPGEGVHCGKNAAAPNGQRKTAMFVIMNDSDSTYGFLVAVLTYLGFNQIKNYADTKCLKKGGKLPIPVQFWLDEFANIGKIADFDQLITTIRSRNIAVTMVLQSLLQLDNVYGKEQAAAIKDACDTWVYLGGCGMDTCEIISKRLGNATVATKNKSKTFSQQNSNSTSLQILQRPLMDPAEVAKMKKRYCLVLLGGDEGYKDVKYRLEDHKRYGLIDPGHKGHKSMVPWGRSWAGNPDEPFDVAEWKRAQDAAAVQASSLTKDGRAYTRRYDSRAADELVYAMVGADAVAQQGKAAPLMALRDRREIDRYIENAMDRQQKTYETPAE